MTKRFPLAFKLLLSIAIVVLLSVALVYFLTATTTTQQFDVYRQYILEEFVQRLGGQFAMYYEQYGGWLGVERLLYRDVEVHIAGQTFLTAIPLVTEPFTFTDPEGRIIASNDLEKKNAAESRVDAETGRPYYLLPKNVVAAGYDVFRGTTLIGKLIPGEVGTDLAPAELEFLETARRSALLGGTIAIGVGLVLSALLVAQILSPLRKLTRATERMAHGDFPKEVKLKSRDEIGQLGESFNHMIEGLRRSEKVRQTMTADIAHELRTPVTIIQGTLEALLDGVYEPTSETIAPIYEETLHLGRLIDDLRDLALAEAGELRLERDPVDLGSLIRQVTEMAVSFSEEAPSLTIEIDPTIPEVSLDSKRIRQVFANLLSNALRHTPPDGEIRVELARGNDGLELSVSDTGIGIAEEDLPRLFERFYRGDPARNRTGGSGLGLAIAKQWVEAHGGRIHAENRSGGGARFAIWLPMA